VIRKLSASSSTLIFHAGTKTLADGILITSGGRVFATVGLSGSLSDSLERSYNGAECINFEGKYFRRDIGQDLLKF